MLNKYYQKNKERLRKEARERYQNLLKNKTIKGEKSLEKDIKILQKNKKKKGVSIIKNVKRTYLTIEEIIM